MHSLMDGANRYHHGRTRTGGPSLPELEPMDQHGISGGATDGCSLDSTVVSCQNPGTQWKGRAIYLLHFVTGFLRFLFVSPGFWFVGLRGLLIISSSASRPLVCLDFVGSWLPWLLFRF